MASQWFVQHTDNQLRPLSLAQISDLVLSGNLPADVLVRREGTEKWVRADDVIEIRRFIKQRQAEISSSIEDDPVSVEATPVVSKAADNPEVIQMTTETVPAPSGRRWLIALALVVLIGSAVSIARFTSRGIRRFPQPGGTTVGRAPHQLAIRAPVPAEPSIPDLKVGVLYPIPGLEHIQPAYSPCLSGDLQTVIFASQEDGSTGYDLFLSSRTDVQSPFEEPLPIPCTITPDTDAYPTLSNDGKELVFQSSDLNPTFRVARRDSVDGDFENAEELNIPGIDPSRFLVGTPQWCGKDVLTFNMTEIGSRSREIYESNRMPDGKGWMEPTQMRFQNSEPAFFITSNKLRAYWSPRSGGLILLSRPSTKDFFEGQDVLVEEDITGPIEGTIWISPKEDLFVFCGPGSRRKTSNDRRLWMVRFQ